MAKFAVVIECKIYKTFEIEAENDRKAEEIAFEMADEPCFSEYELADIYCLDDNW